MTAIEHADIIWLAVVSILGGYQIATFAIAVGKCRQKHKIDPPKTDGPDEFLRTFRAQQNSLEFFTMFMCIMWIAGLFFHQVPAALAGFGYIYGREQYFRGYCKSAQGRVPGFHKCELMLKILLTMAVTGMVHHALLMYTSINMKTAAYGFVGFQ